MSECDHPARAARLAMRRGEWTGPTKHAVPGYVQCNLVVLPRADAYDFLVYCQRNPKPCPLLEVTDPGDPAPHRLAPGADVRTDLSRYVVYRDGLRSEERTDITDLWRADSVAFLIGSGMSFDDALERAGVPKGQTWLYETAIETEAAGRFAGPMVVTMRLMSPAQAVVACQLTSRFVYNHGAPLHMGDPSTIGIDLEQPIVGPPLQDIPEGQMALFWGCGVTPQWAALRSRVELLIGHAPAHAFVTDRLSDQHCLP
ncbi:MAG: D-glutamate cyclase family protein [Candidatus Latescibacterota bacterium]